MLPAGCAAGEDGSELCPSEAQYVDVVRALRAALPRPLLLTAATWTVGAHGLGALGWGGAAEVLTRSAKQQQRRRRQQQQRQPFSAGLLELWQVLSKPGGMVGWLLGSLLLPLFNTQGCLVEGGAEPPFLSFAVFESHSS